MFCLAHASNDPDPDTLPKTLSALLDVYRTLAIPPPVFALAERLITALLLEHGEDSEELLLTKMDLGKSYWNEYHSASKFPQMPQNFIVVGDAFAKYEDLTSFFVSDLR